MPDHGWMRGLRKRTFASTALLVGAALLAFAEPGLESSLITGIAVLVGPSGDTSFAPVHLPLSETVSGRTLTLNSIKTAPAATPGRTDVQLGVAISNAGTQSFPLATTEFFLTSRGDFFGAPAGSNLGPQGVVPARPA